VGGGASCPLEAGCASHDADRVWPKLKVIQEHSDCGTLLNCAIVH
jgi:hypothetical protein